MPIWKLQCAIAGDSVLERDPFVITPHFNDQGVGTDPQQLCEDMATALATYCGVARQIVVSAYDAEGAQPVYAAGRAERSMGVVVASYFPREVALCLSFYSTRNVPRQRGRLYMPAPILSSSAGPRPTTSQQQKVMDFGPICANLGGVDVDWVVWSRVDQTARPVTDYWCDNEWDTVRSRGLRGTSRLLGTTTEA